MLTKIKSCYRGLNLTLDKLAAVNYLVGINGSGKTRLMRSIELKINQYKDPVNFEAQEKLEKVKFFVDENTEFDLSKDGFLLNNLFDIDAFMVQGEKRTRVPLFDTFRDHPFTQKLLGIFLPGRNFELEMRGDNQIGFRDVNSEVEWIMLEELAAGFQSIFKLWNHVHFNGLSIAKGAGVYILCLDELDRHLHPSIARELPRLLEELILEIEKLVPAELGNARLKKIQIFISTHSPFTVRGALNHENHKIFYLEGGALKHSFDRTAMLENFGAPFDKVLADLGFKMHDLYYPETLICVEGPVDVMYIQYWLEKYLEEIGLPTTYFKRGVDYDFFEFGGSLAAHLTLRFNGSDFAKEELSVTDLVNIFSLNRKVFLVVDDDSGAAFEPTKVRLRELIETREGCCFFKDSSYTTIECLLTEETQFSSSHRKVSAALINLREWRRRNIPLRNFNPMVYPLMEELKRFLSSAIGSSAKTYT